MKKPALLIIVLTAFLMHCNDGGDGNGNKDNIVKKLDRNIGNSQIPYIIITTSGDIQNEDKVAATMEIYKDKLLDQTQTIGIEYRGSTSFRVSQKKSYGIETWDKDGNDVDVSILGMPAEEDWILQGHVWGTDGSGNPFTWDPTLMFHYVAYNLYRDMGGYASRTKYVELEIDGEYQGVYVLMEKLKRDNNRIDISGLSPGDTDNSGGYIIKIDKTSGGDLDLPAGTDFDNNWADDARYNESISFRSNYDINGNLIDFPAYGEPYHSQQYLETYFLYEYPKAADITAAQKTYIQTYINDFETALLTDDFNSNVRSYTNFINVDNFVDFFIINELCKNIDGYRLSTFLYKDKAGKLHAGPPWDFNIGYYYHQRIHNDQWVINYNDYVFGDAWSMPFWWPRLMEDPQFRSAIKTRWTALRNGALSDNALASLVDETANYLTSNGAVERNLEKWPFPESYTDHISNLKAYFVERTTWMDSQISAF